MPVKTTPKIERRKVSDLKTPSNIRSDLGSQASLHRLGKSLAKGQHTPLLILSDGTVVDGFRRVAAALLEGIEELDCVLVDADITPGECRQIQWRCAVLREDISPYDKAVTIRAIKDDYPGITNRQLAEDILDIDPSSVTLYLKLFDCIPQVQEAARAGKINLTGWVAISKSPDQARALAGALNDSNPGNDSGPGSESENRPHNNGNGQKPVRPSRINIPLASDAATGTVTVAGSPGEDLDLEHVENLLKEAQKAVRLPRLKISQTNGTITVTVVEEGSDPDDTETLLKEAQKAVHVAIAEKMSARTAQAAWRDKAKGGD